MFISLNLFYEYYVDFDWCRKVPGARTPCSTRCTHPPARTQGRTRDGKIFARCRRANPIDLLAIFPLLAIPAPGFSRNIRESDWILYASELMERQFVRMKISTVWNSGPEFCVFFMKSQNRESVIMNCCTGIMNCCTGTRVYIHSTIHRHF